MSAPQPTKRHFHDELDALQQRLMRMAGMVESLVARASEAVLKRDRELAKTVVHDDHDVDVLEVDIDEQVLELLALHQPMARDLRMVIAANKASNDLERVGDHAVNIAKATKRMRKYRPLPDFVELEEMTRMVRRMLSNALAAYIARDSEAARAVCDADVHVDDLRRVLFRILVAQMLEESEYINGALELLLVTQNLERIADLATNIAEDVVFLVEGVTIKHGAEEWGADDPDDDELG